jgi:hypothetical protein
LLQAAGIPATSGHRRCYNRQAALLQAAAHVRCYCRRPQLLQPSGGAATIARRRCYNRLAPVLQSSGGGATIVWRRCYNRLAPVLQSSGGGRACYTQRRRCYNPPAALLQSPAALLQSLVGAATILRRCCYNPSKLRRSLLRRPAALMEERGAGLLYKGDDAMRDGLPFFQERGEFVCLCMRVWWSRWTRVKQRTRGIRFLIPRGTLSAALSLTMCDDDDYAVLGFICFGEDGRKGCAGVVLCCAVGCE